MELCRTEIVPQHGQMQDNLKKLLIFDPGFFFITKAVKIISGYNLKGN